MKLFLTCFLALFSTVFAVDISNLDRCIDDVKEAIATGGKVMLFTPNYAKLMQDLEMINVRDALPPVYQKEVFDPFLAYLKKLEWWGFKAIFAQQSPDPQTAFLQQLIPAVSEAILQKGTQYAEQATKAFQEVVIDFYDGFLSEESRLNKETGDPIKLPDGGTLAPLVKWGNADGGPYMWPLDATIELNVHSAIVSLPSAYYRKGLVAWISLLHERGGHDILQADKGLLEELGNLVYSAVLAEVGDTFLANYWKQCINETASDVLGLLNAGPTAGIGLVAYVRSLTGGVLQSTGALPPADTHPIDVLRGYLAAQVVSQLSFAEAKEWSDVIRNEVHKDLKTLYVVDSKTSRYHRLQPDQAIKSAEIVGDVIANAKLDALEGHSLKEIQDWTDADQEIVDALAELLKTESSLPDDYKNSGYYATHVLAAAIQEALKEGTNVQTMFDNMIGFLDIMHQYNKVWYEVPVLPPAPAPVPCTCVCECPCCGKCRPVEVSEEL